MEWVRRNIRGLLGWDSWVYRFASNLYSDLSIIRSEGFATLFKLRRLQRTDSHDGQPVAVKFKQLNHPFWLRPGTKDIGTAISNFVREEYGQYNPERPPLTLIDAGAYIGDTSAYFLSQFPNLKSWAVEPNPVSLRIAEKNLAPYQSRATLLPFALSDEETTVFLSGEETGATITENDGFEVKTTTISNLLKLLPEGRANILKMDIEGAENSIFLSNPERWLPFVDCIIVETHGPEITRNVLSALDQNNWRAVRYRNLYYCTPIK